MVSKPSQRQLISAPLQPVCGAVVRLRIGHVVDFLDLHSGGRNIWPIFNVADICINIGVVLLILYFWRYPEPKEERSLPTPEASIKQS